MLPQAKELFLLEQGLIFNLGYREKLKQQKPENQMKIQILNLMGKKMQLQQIIIIILRDLI